MIAPVRRAGLVGLGAIAPYFARALAQSPRWQLTAVCDHDPARLEVAYASAARKSTTMDELLVAGELDAVFLTLPNDLHGSAIGAALRAGLHVCCEKPLTVEAAEARALADAAVAAGLVLLTASHRRENRHVRALAAELDRARVVRARCRYLELIEEHTGGERWYLDAARCGGGCLIDNGPNAIDALRVVLGELDVVACALEPPGVDGELRAEVALRTRDGVPVTVELDWTHPGQVKDVTLWLDDGSVRHADMLAGTSTLKGSLEHEYAAIVERFATLIDAGAPVRDDDGVRVAELVAAAYALGRGA